MNTLTKEHPISEDFGFEGNLNLLIFGGIGTVILERSVNGSEFFPLSTDINGGIAAFTADGGCVYNGTLEEKGLNVRYRLHATIDSGEIYWTKSRSKT